MPQLAVVNSQSMWVALGHGHLSWSLRSLASFRPSLRAPSPHILTDPTPNLPSYDAKCIGEFEARAASRIGGVQQTTKSLES